MARRYTKRKKTLPKKIKIYGYVRVSTEEQAREGLSLDVQIAKIEVYALLYDFVLIEIICDEG